MTGLVERFTGLAPAARQPEAARLARDLLARWDQPHRRYHDRSHLIAVLDAVDLLADQAAAPDTVRLAAWFHDAVHDGQAGADEEASAALAAATLPGVGLDEQTVADVVRLVLLTTAHDPAGDDPDGCVLSDADLSVLGGDPQAYAAYAAAVRQEYADVPEDAFRVGRRTVLERLLARDPIFRTTPARRRWEQRARRNLTAEITLLRAAGTPG